MVRTIQIEMDNFPTTCFDCDFSKKEYCWATCPFLNITTEDRQPTPSRCPLKKKNAKKVYKILDK
jgi:hypothetical protein